ncbi:helix-turn-helix domain-containing protein [Humisphaera borealis]|uniref:Transcriptional regulator n=1 Tax=Humisphaera borealis TaxID=2807512 RepID=A0A7M2WRT5_9BACT|nr:hypothetical protein [Humisphaera borealis]QOV87872.1 transcriptional regulator [Humisphaera borealis]
MESANMPRIKHILSRDLPASFEALVRIYPPRAIQDEVDYKNTQELIDALTNRPKLSKGQADYLETLTQLFEVFEEEHEAIDSDLSPLDALRELLEQHAMSASDLGRLLGDRALGSRILSGDRELSKAHIRTLAEHFAVSADLFL